MQNFNANEPYIYVYYPADGSDAIAKTVKSLTEAGFRLWHSDKGDIDRKHLESCGVFLAFLSNTEIDTANFMSAIDYAMNNGKSPLVVYLDNVKLTLGMRMLLGSVQGIYYNRHSSHESFVEELCSSRILAKCREGGTVKTKSLVSNAEIAYRRGIECKTNNMLVDAANWFKRGADLGNSAAQLELGRIYYYGTGYDQNYEKAVWWLKKAADQGELRALSLLADCYRYGKGVPEDQAKAKRLEKTVAAKKQHT